MPKLNQVTIDAYLRLKEGYLQLHGDTEPSSLVSRSVDEIGYNNAAIIIANVAINCVTNPRTNVATVPEVWAIDTSIEGICALIGDAPLVYEEDEGGGAGILEALRMLPAVCGWARDAGRFTQATRESVLQTLKAFIETEPTGEYATHNCGGHPKGLTCHGHLVVVATRLYEDLDFPRPIDPEEVPSVDDLDKQSALSLGALVAVLDSKLPHANKDDRERYDLLLHELEHFHVRTIGGLNYMIALRVDDVLQRDRQRADSINNDKSGPVIHSSRVWERAAKGVFDNHTELVRSMLKCHMIGTRREDWYAYYEGAYPDTC